MLIDKRGFIWIAHNFGVSRYDGISFTSFSNPGQSSLSATDLIEDNYGRIWFHNFNGQIFYIKDDKMFYFKEYDFKEEPMFPRMILYGDDLIITSNLYGLFICNTTTLKSKYVKIADKDSSQFASTSSLCLLKGKILAYGSNKWYTYTTRDGLHLLKDAALMFKKEAINFPALQPRTSGDTAFIKNNVDNSLYGVTLCNDKLTLVFAQHPNSNINSVCTVHGRTWINTRIGSYTLDRKDSIIGHNITTMIDDRQGNKWFGSLNEGLLAVYRAFNWQAVTLKQLANTDRINFITKTGKWFAISSKDEIIITEKLKSGTKDTYTISPQKGTIENIQAADSNNFFIETSTNLFILNAATKQLKNIDSGVTVKDIALNNQTAFVSLPGSVLIANTRGWKVNNSNKTTESFLINDSLIFRVDNKVYFKKRMRSRAVLFDTLTNSLLISFSDGLQRLQHNKFTDILYKDQPLYVSSMARYNNKIYIATFNNGLFVIDKYEMKKIENTTESPLDGIVKIKLCNKHLWIFRPHDTELLDISKDEFITNIYPLPAVATDITDAEEDSSNIYLVTREGLYTIPLSENAEIIKEDPTLLYVLVNNVDTLLHSNVFLPAIKNNLLFKLAIPVYKDAERLHFRYRLMNGDISSNEDPAWYYTQDAQREIQFNALKPGSYSLEIIAVKDNEVISNKPLVYHFTISQPWYNTWWFYTVIMSGTISIVLAIYQYRLRQVFKIERIRRKISNDLHDDIGSSLSSINVYSQLAKTGKDNLEYIETIQTNAVSIINNLDDLVWNINPKNDALEYLITRMRLFALPILGEKDIDCVFKVKTYTPHMLVAPNVRADIYMLFKEMINNVIKHSACNSCSIYIIQKGKHLRLTVKDDGRGFNIKNINPHRNGLRIMGERVKDIKGSIDIHSLPGNGTEIRITCRLK